MAAIHEEEIQIVSVEIDNASRKRIVVDNDEDDDGADEAYVIDDAEEEEGSCEVSEDEVASPLPKKNAPVAKKPRMSSSTPLSGLLAAKNVEAACSLLRSMDHSKLLEISEAMCKMIRADVEPEKIELAVTTMKKALQKNLKSAMTWKKSCKQGGATFKVSVVCPPAVFHAVFGAPKGKVKILDARKMPCAQFWEHLGTEVRGSTRYGSLDAMGDISARYHMETNELAVSGRYGC